MFTSRLARAGVSAAFACALLLPLRARATGVPIGGFLPIVGISLTDKFKDQNDDTFLFADPEPSYSGSPLGPGASAHYDLALYDTGAAVSSPWPSILPRITRATCFHRRTVPAAARYPARRA